MEKKNILIPSKVEFIIQTLQEQGFEAYAVGGCVRDSILGKNPMDWDITTSALPEDVKALFPRTVDTGIQHGTVTVLLDKEGFEVTTYRIDGEYADGRHPKEVLFTRSLKEDLRRRDFTMNAMAYNTKEGIVDIFGGMEDMGKKIIRCVGIPEERFGEDALRILRAVRFSGQLGFQIEKHTKTAMKKLSENLALISRERIQAELVKLLVSDNPAELKAAYETGITKTILPEFDQIMKTGQAGEHALLALKEVPPHKVLRLAVLFHGMAEQAVNAIQPGEKTEAEITKKILKDLRFDNDTMDKVTRLVKWHHVSIPLTKEGVRRAVFHVGEDIFPLLLQVRKADITAGNLCRRKDDLKTLEEIEKLYARIVEDKDPVSLKGLKISGKDLIEEGLKPGVEIGELLGELLDLVIKNPVYNEKQLLLQKARELIKDKEGNRF